MSLTVVISTKKIDESFKSHVITSSGIKDIEVLMYENPNGIALTEIYNRGLNESKNNIVVFCHDDIIFNKQKWGLKLLKDFQDYDFGILGVAGTTYMSENGRWWTDKSKMVGIVKHTHNGKTWVSKYSSKFSKPIEVCCVDGVFFVCDKEKIKNNFDENFKGFHFYDVDFSFSNHLNNVKVGVTFSVEITHKSIGMTNEEWEKNRLIFVEKIKTLNKSNPILPKKLKSEIFYENKNLNLKYSPKVEVIIPNINNYDLLTGCISSFLNISKYQNLKITVADTGSSPEILKRIKEFCSNKNVKLLFYDYYHFEKINNDVVKNHLDNDTELLLFCNNDIELINDCVSEMVNLYLKNKKTCGTVGARLYFKDNTIQHAGIHLGVTINKNNQFGLQIGHVGFKSEYNYPTTDMFDTIGNTAALQMISKDLFIKMGYFPEHYLDSLSDVEFNLKCILWNKKNIFAHNAVAYHYESQTRDVKGQIKSEDYLAATEFVKNNKKILNKIKIYQV
jgi:GT2 family glycosyltransferase